MKTRKLKYTIAIMLIALVSWSLLGCGGETEMTDNTDQTDFTVSGDRGPWTYIYFQKNPKKQLEFEFASWDRLAEFESFCAEMAGLEE